MKFCKECGTEFEPVVSHQSICSDACRLKRDLHRSKVRYDLTRKKDHPRRCLQCEKLFEPTHGSKQLCSRECEKARAAYRARRNRQL